MSSRGEMKMSLRLMTLERSVWCASKVGGFMWYILMSKMLQQLQFSVCAFREDRSAEGFHNLLDRHRLAGELILRRAESTYLEMIFNQAALKCSPYHTSPNAPMPTGCRSVYLSGSQ